MPAVQKRLRTRSKKPLMADERQLVTRTDLRRGLVVNALTKPINVVVPAAVAVAALLTGVTWLIAVAVVVYAVLAVLTFFDEGEAEKVGQRLYGERGGGSKQKRLDVRTLAGPIGQQVQAARDCETRIQDTIAHSDMSFAEVDGEVDSLVRAVELIAQRAQRIYDYLATQDLNAIDGRLAQLQGSADPSAQAIVKALTDQRNALTDLQGQLTSFYSRIEQLVASLGTVNSQLVRMSVASEEEDQTELAEQVRGLREQVDALSAGMKEAYGRAPDTPEVTAPPS
jgi:archaellum component FlaC